MDASGEHPAGDGTTARDGAGATPGLPAGLLATTYPVTVELLLAAPRHRYEGRPADGPAPADGPELHERITVRAGLGIVGDRFHGHPAHRQASVTVIGAEPLEALAAELGIPLDPALTRRNVVLRGVDVEALRGVLFSIDTGSGPVVLQGHRAANPCAWMDVAIGPGVFRGMRGRGGIRCEPLTDGVLTLGPGTLRAAVPLG
ncbi:MULTISPECIES: MOSC domain-containing protein [unclassified Curtobacterium]|uniref:MOSC domain-containing protein n=1 Tax=unclassified Curtobacterium TaxID=257496 RepID=UPI0021AD143E|nr:MULTISPECIES: molybdenum cofactor biosysynthesis protein [unclassified Curtobacterium]